MDTKEMKNYEKIQGVINTLEMMEPIRPTAENASKLWGVYRTLMEVRDDLFRQEQEKQGEEKQGEENTAEVDKNAGEADAE